MKKAFTLIELLIVVSIISLLIITGFFLARNQYVKGRDARRKADIHKIQEAAEEYEKDHDCYPQSITCGSDVTQEVHPYLNQVPCDSATGSSYYYENDSPSCAKWYRIFISLDNLNDKGIIPGIGPSGEYNFYLASPNAPVPVASTPAPTSPPLNPLCSVQNYYGCIDGVCVQIAKKPDGCPVCQPGYDNPICNVPGNCGTPENPLNECTP